MAFWFQLELLVKIARRHGRIPPLYFVGAQANMLTLDTELDVKTDMLSQTKVPECRCKAPMPSKVTFNAHDRSASNIEATDTASSTYGCMDIPMIY